MESIATRYRIATYKNAFECAVLWCNDPWLLPWLRCLFLKAGILFSNSSITTWPRRNITNVHTITALSAGVNICDVSHGFYCSSSGPLYCVSPCGLFFVIQVYNRHDKVLPIFRIRLSILLLFYEFYCLYNFAFAVNIVLNSSCKRCNKTI